MERERTPANPAGRGGDAKQTRLERHSSTGAAPGPRRNLLLRLRRHGDLSHLSDIELAERCERYIQARTRPVLRSWAQDQR